MDRSKKKCAPRKVVKKARKHNMGVNNFANRSPFDSTSFHMEFPNKRNMPHTGLGADLNAECPKKSDDILDEINGEFESLEEAITGVDLVKASKAIIGMTGEFQKLLKDGKLDAAITRTVVTGGTVASHVTVNVLEMYKEVVKVVVPRLEGIGDMLEDYEPLMDSVGKAWTDAMKQSPKSALKILRYKKQLKKAFKSFKAL